MKIYCGEYWDWNPPKRFPWRKLAIIALCVASTTAAAPAVISYYWSGQKATRTLPVSEALLLVQDQDVPMPMRRSAAGKVFISAKAAIQALQATKQGRDKVASDSGIYLQRLTNHLRK